MPPRKVATPKAPQGISIDKFINYILIVSLILLLLYAFMYVMQLTKSTRETFDQKGRYTVLYVYSDSCSFCRAFTSTFERFSKEIAMQYPNVHVDKKEVSQLDPVESKKLNITAFPTIVVFDTEGKEVNRIIGKRDLYPLMREVMGSFVLNNTSSRGH
jgi:thiol-disulfide isomerase/thioredoxin